MNSRRLYVNIPDRARVWLEGEAIPLPDPFAPEDVRDLIAAHYPGGCREFALDCHADDIVVNSPPERSRYHPGCETERARWRRV